MFSFENTSFLSPFWPFVHTVMAFLQMKTEFIKNAKWINLKPPFCRQVWTVKMEAFENDDACLLI